MSTSEEIQAVYEQDIARMTHQVVNRQGLRPLLEGVRDMHVFKMTAPVFGDGDSVVDWAPPRDKDE